MSVTRYLYYSLYFFCYYLILNLIVFCLHKYHENENGYDDNIGQLVSSIFSL